MTEHTALESEPRNPIEGHLEGLARSMAEAINSRDFSIRSRIWSHVASDFVAETGFSEWPRRTTSLTEFLSRFVSHTASHPEYSMHLNEVSTKLNEKTGRAYVWVTPDKSRQAHRQTFLSSNLIDIDLRHPPLFGNPKVSSASQSIEKMAVPTAAALPQADSFPTPFPAPSKSASGEVNGIRTEVSSIAFTDKIVITISQAGKLAHWVHVPIAAASADPMNPGMMSTSSSENNLLPMSHLTATTVLGGTKREDEVVGQTLATTIASAILMKSPSEERLLVVGLGFEDAAGSFTGRAQFDEAVGLVLEVL